MNMILKSVSCQDKYWSVIESLVIQGPRKKKNTDNRNPTKTHWKNKINK